MGGITLGADPIVTAVSITSALRGWPVPAFIIRKEPKKHGTAQWIEGTMNLREGMRVAILEDVVTTGASTLKAIERAVLSGLVVARVLCLVDRNEGGAEAVAAAGYRVEPRFVKEDVENACPRVRRGGPGRPAGRGVRRGAAPGRSPCTRRSPARLPMPGDGRPYAHPGGPRRVDTRFVFSATWLSEAWVKAFAEEYSSIYYLDPARSGRVIGLWRGESDRYVRFFVALWVPDDRGNDLEKPGSIWSLRLVRSDEKDFEPAYVRATSLRPEEVSRFFPYSGAWYRSYEVAFPKEADSPPEPPKEGAPRLKLVLAGVQGRAVLTWR